MLATTKEKPLCIINHIRTYYWDAHLQSPPTFNRLEELVQMNSLWKISALLLTYKAVSVLIDYTYKKQSLTGLLKKKKLAQMYFQKAKESSNVDVDKNNRTK